MFDQSSRHVEVPVPPSVNHLYRRGRGKRRWVRSRSYERWLDVAVPLMRFSLQRAPLPAAVLVTIRGGKGWSAGRDIDNTLKACLDALVMAGRLPDDTCANVNIIVVRFVPAVPGLSAGCEVGWLDEGRSFN